MPLCNACRTLTTMPSRLVAVLSALLVAILWVSPESIAYLCSMDGQKRSACCCAPDGEHAGRSHDEVERAACCEIERTPANVSPAVSPTTDDTNYLATASAWTPTRELGGPFTARDFIPTLARGPPQSIGPPPYLRNCRFLI